MNERKNQEGQDPRSEVYDLLGRLKPEAVEHAIQLFVLGGQKWFAGGYFFEHDSGDYLRELAKVHVSDADGNELGTLDSKDAAIKAFYLGGRRPSWLVEGQTYQVAEPKVDGDNEGILWDIRGKILERIRVEGEKAGEEFLLVGTVMGGVEQTPEEIVKEIQEAFKRPRK